MPPPCHPSRKSDRCQRTLPSTEGKTYRDSRFPGDARHALYSREAHGAGRAWEALDAAGAVGTLDALRAQLPSTARLEENRTRWVGGKQCPAAAAPPPRRPAWCLLWTLSLEWLPATYLSFGSDWTTGTLQESSCSHAVSWWHLLPKSRAGTGGVGEGVKQPRSHPLTASGRRVATAVHSPGYGFYPAGTVFCARRFL